MSGLFRFLYVVSAALTGLFAKAKKQKITENSAQNIYFLFKKIPPFDFNVFLDYRYFCKTHKSFGQYLQKTALFLTLGVRKADILSKVKLAE